MSHILVIEDDEGIRLNIADILELEGFSIQQADNGEMGVALAKDYLPDLIICDIMMPGLDGYQVLLELRSYPTTASIPFIFLTAKADRLSIRHGMELGAGDYLTKPFTTSELVTAVESRLETHARITQEYEHQLDALRDSIVLALPHELRTPLTGILGYGELLSADYATLGPEQVGKIGEVIVRSGERLRRLIENFLLYAQLEIVQIDNKRYEHAATAHVDDPGDIIALTAQERAAQAGRQADLVMETHNTPVQIKHDNLKKIAYELLDNAFKFSQPGTTVEVYTKSYDTGYVFCVTDVGRGMTAEEIKRVGAYMQFGRQMYEQQGLGLGLVLARRLAELHRGQLNIKSELDQGTQICVELPHALA